MQTLTQTWTRFFRLHPSERRIVVTAGAALVLTRIGLALFDFRVWKSALHATFPGPLKPPASESDATVETIVRFHAAAARHLFRTTCLERSLVLWWFLQRRSIPADLRFGARNFGGSFEAHAWVELAGKILNDPGGTHRLFAPFGASFPSIEAESR